MCRELSLPKGTHLEPLPQFAIDSLDEQGTGIDCIRATKDNNGVEVIRLLRRMTKAEMAGMWDRVYWGRMTGTSDECSPSTGSYTTLQLKCPERQLGSCVCERRQTSKTFGKWLRCLEFGLEDRLDLAVVILFAKDADGSFLEVSHSCDTAHNLYCATRSHWSIETKRWNRVRQSHQAGTCECNCAASGRPRCTGGKVRYPTSSVTATVNNLLHMGTQNAIFLANARGSLQSSQSSREERS